MHRVSLPDLFTVPESGLPVRYSIPFFAGSTFDHIIAPAQIPQFVNGERPCLYEPISCIDYIAERVKHQYDGSKPDGAV